MKTKSFISEVERVVSAAAAPIDRFEHANTRAKRIIDHERSRTGRVLRHQEPRI